MTRAVRTLEAELAEMSRSLTGPCDSECLPCHLRMLTEFGSTKPCSLGQPTTTP